jgi:hypothetical protein
VGVAEARGRRSDASLTWGNPSLAAASSRLNADVFESYGTL